MPAIDQQDLAENEIQIKDLCVAMIGLAVTDITAHRGGKSTNYWAESARKWVKDIRPGDESYPTTFAGCCAVLNLPPKKISKILTSGKIAAVRKKRWLTSKLVKNRDYSKTWWKCRVIKTWACEYCGDTIPAKTLCHSRYIGSGGLSYACEKCSRKDHDPNTVFKNEFRVKKEAVAS